MSENHDSNENHSLGVNKTNITAPLYPDKGPNFVTYELKEDDNKILSFQPTNKLLSFLPIYIGLGVASCLLGVIVAVLSHDPLALIGIPAGLVLIVIGSRAKKLARMIRRIDSNQRTITVPRDAESHSSDYRTYSFDQVESVQLLEKNMNGGEDNDYPCFELNLVLKSNQRAMFVHHSDGSILRADGQRIADIVGCNFIEQSSSLQK